MADGATEPATVARFADLLWCRRIPGAGLHAARAARAYLQLAATGDIDMDGMEFLLRAWTLTRRIAATDLDQQTRARLAQVASDVPRRPARDPAHRPRCRLPVPLPQRSGFPRPAAGLGEYQGVGLFSRDEAVEQGRRTWRQCNGAARAGRPRPGKGAVAVHRPRDPQHRIWAEADIFDAQAE
ncbi:DUF7380 domain-containing protein [Winogradskya humida]|uniref:DUF7380 domain-containing protein n=1 Tax=Winogradskya humida TaxID=113566 RepID=UPI003F6911CF